MNIRSALAAVVLAAFLLAGCAPPGRWGTASCAAGKINGTPAPSVQVSDGVLMKGVIRFGMAELGSGFYDFDVAKVDTTGFVLVSSDEFEGGSRLLYPGDTYHWWLDGGEYQFAAAASTKVYFKCRAEVEDPWIWHGDTR